MSTAGMHIGGVRTLADLKSRCVEVGDCWEWQRHINSNNVPQVRFNGTPQSARRIAWAMQNGPVPKGMVVTHTCGNHRCINPDHATTVKPATVLRQNMSSANEALRRARITATKRRQMGVAPSVVAAVRADSDTLASVLARQLGVSDGTVYKLRRQATAASPWGGLVRVAA